MAYQKCNKEVISLLKNKYKNKIWEKTKEDYSIILKELLKKLASKSLCLDTEICRKMHDEIYKGLTISKYRIPLMDIDIDPSLRQFNEYNKDYDECVIEEENNNFKFNLG